MAIWIGLGIGIILGMFISWIFYRISHAEGFLRIDDSDPDSGPYLFLELSNKDAGKIEKKRQICLRIKRENYLPQEEHGL